MLSAGAKLVEWVVQFFELFRFIRIINAWEVGIVLRLGRFSRVLPPGPHFVWPFAIEAVATEWSTPQVKLLPAQSLTTADNKSIILAGMVTWRCVDVHKLLVETGGHEAVLLDACPGTITEIVARTVWTDLVSEKFQKELLRRVRHRARKCGIEVDEVQLSDLSVSKTLRLVSRGTLEA